MKNKMKEAHNLTRELKSKYNEVDYKTQFGLCLSYLNNKEVENMNKFNFITNQGLDAFVTVSEGKNGNLKVETMNVNGTDVYIREKGNYSDCNFDIAYDRKADIRRFSVKIQKDTLKTFMKVSGIKANVKSAYIAIANEELESLYKELPKKRQQEKAEKAEKVFNINKDMLISACYSNGSFRVRCSELENSKSIKEIEYNLSKFGAKDILKEFETEVDWGEYSTTTYYEVTIGQLEEANRSAMRNKIDKEVAAAKKEADEEKRIANLFEIAKNTGKKQVIKSYSCECNDSNEECDVDNVTTYAMPDGSEKTVRSHTW